MSTSMERFESCYLALKEWAGSLLQDGWLTPADTEKLELLETAHADALFDAQQRPLLVAFFGGTGVGKSSLLNRLAGSAIAKVGVVRPTSHQVTLYLHQDYKDSLHEQELPTVATRVVYHSDDSRKYFAWLDMPDIDSTEQSNRAIVEQWLPVLDWLVYVVTPDRYQDDLGWHFVQARGNKHAWLFVMNHWDEGLEAQRDDFSQRLLQQGFQNPRVFRTSCTVELADDDFAALEDTLAKALEKHGLEKLQKLALDRQWSALDSQIDQLYQRVQDSDAWKAMVDDWDMISRQGISELGAMLGQNAGLLYQRWLAQEALQPEKLPVLEPGPQVSDSEKTVSSLNPIYDVRCRNRLHALALGLENRFTRHRLPLPPAQARLNGLLMEAEAELVTSIHSGMASALQKPGNLATRFLRRLFGFLQWALPLVAAGWAGYHVIQRFIAGTMGEGAFLGLNFAIHSLLLIALAWFVPWIVLRQLRPSLAKAAFTGVKRGVSAGTEQVAVMFDECWTALEAGKQAHLTRLQVLRDNYATDLARTGSVLSGFTTAD